MKAITQTLILLLFNVSLVAQTYTIRGNVSDGEGPLPGATITVKGASNTCHTNFDGNYVVQAQPTDILIFSFVGYASKNILVGEQKVINVTLESNNVLDEVIVTHQGIKRKRSAVGYAVSEIRSALSRNKREKDVSRVLSGKASGVAITSQSGAAGTATNVVIRGYSSISGNRPSIATKSIPTSVAIQGSANGTLRQNNKGLAYIVDGVRIDQSLNFLIEEMEHDQIDGKTMYDVDRAQKLFGYLEGRECAVITTKKGNYRIENDESYKELFENPFKSVSYDPLSTFSIDVDRASYSNIRRMINNGQHVPFDAIKVEEMINYFDYDYDSPTDDRPFAAHTEIIKTPWNEKSLLMKVGLKGKEINPSDLPPSNITFLIDVSGSMSAVNKLPLLKSAFTVLVDNLTEKDKVAIVVYAGAAGIVLEPTSGDKKEEILEALHNLSSGGSTAGGEGIELAYKLAQENFKKNGNNRVVLATDGDFNVGASSDKAMEKLIGEKRKTGVFLTCLGFGMGNYKDSKLETLADKGNGNYAYIDTMQEAHKFLGKEFSGTLFTIAKDVKIQVEFNPANVKSYRLIGYENRLLNNEDFKDDTKDAGEIGAGHTVTALYEIVPTNSDYNAVAGEALKYQASIPTAHDELLTVKIRYKKPDGNKSMVIEHVVKNEISEKVSADLNFMSAVAMFGMKLRKSEYVQHISKSELITLARSGKGEDEDGFRAEFVRLIKASQP